MKTEEELKENLDLDQTNVNPEKVKEVEVELAEDDPDDITPEESI